MIQSLFKVWIKSFDSTVYIIKQYDSITLLCFTLETNIERAISFNDFLIIDICIYFAIL